MMEMAMGKSKVIICGKPLGCLCCGLPFSLVSPGDEVKEHTFSSSTLFLRIYDQNSGV